MKLLAKVVVVTWQQLAVTRAFALAVGVCPGMVLLKFLVSEDCQVAL
jgi:hypothetical protein